MDVMQTMELDGLKQKHWRSWFEEPIPMIGNVSPREAAETAQGRERLDEVFALYDSLRGTASSGNNLDLNVPTKWAKWKLGYGPGSAEEFAEEEAIFNYRDDRMPTQRTQKHSNRLEEKIKTVFIPNRCEVVGCDKRENLKRCGRCNCASYCCREHQQQDWPRHKLECKFLSNYANLKPRFYNTSEELEQYPIGCYPFQTARPLEEEKCRICGAGADEVNLGYTPCCNAPICDNSFEYQVCSYSREYCLRSHMHYTRCSTHFEEEHDGSDWRECEICNKLDEHETRPFATTNAFNVVHALEQNLPQGSFITAPCSVSTCKNRILPGHDTTVVGYLPGGGVGQLCSKCSARR